MREREKREESVKERETERGRERDVFNSGIQTQTVIIIMLLGSGRKQPKQVWMSVYPGPMGSEMFVCEDQRACKKFSASLRARKKKKKNNARVRVESRRSQRRKRGAGGASALAMIFPFVLAPALQQLWASAKRRSVGNASGLGARAARGGEDGEVWRKGAGINGTLMSQ